MRLKFCQKDPNYGNDDGDACEDVARLGTEGALSSHAAEGACQPAASTALEQDQADQKYPEKHVQGQQHISQSHPHCEEFLRFA